MHKSNRLGSLLLKLTSRSFIVCLISASAATSICQQPAGAKLAKIEFEGLQRLAPEQLIKTSGLEIGQSVDPATLDAAAQRLLDSGLIKKLGYRYRPTGNQATVIFQIEEAAGGEHRVIFDNFIWFTDEELMNAVRRGVPTFNGSVPDAGNLTDAVARALQLFLSEQKIVGKVEYLPATDRTGKIDAHIFVVREIKMPICTLHFPGAQNVDESRLTRAAQELLGTEYSKSFADAFAANSLFLLYREVGQLRAAFAPARGKPASNATCKDGVDLTIGVAEGAVYSWNKAEWSGNQALAEQELDAALGMKSGEVANGLKFDKGALAVQKAYGRRGYITAALRSRPEFDDAGEKVLYRIEVREGPQYRMGTLIIKGFPDNIANFLRGKFEMRPGDVYDQGYVEEFFKGPFRDIMRTLAEERVAQGKTLPKNVGTDAKPNRSSLAVDLTIELRD